MRNIQDALPGFVFEACDCLDPEFCRQRDMIRELVPWQMSMCFAAFWTDMAIIDSVDFQQWPLCRECSGVLTVECLKGFVESEFAKETR